MWKEIFAYFISTQLITKVRNLNYIETTQTTNNKFPMHIRYKLFA